MTQAEQDAELQAIQQILAALDPLDDESRDRVITYVFQRLGIHNMHRAAAPGSMAPAEPYEPNEAPPPMPREFPERRQDIRSLAEQKVPKNVVDRVTLVAYYLGEVAPQSERKASISGADVTKYFKQAGFPIPASTRGALFAARDAGYLDVVERGAYKLNPVGHNRIVHSLPADSGTSGRKSTSRRKSARKKETVRKQSTGRKKTRSRR